MERPQSCLTISQKIIHHKRRQSIGTCYTWAIYTLCTHTSLQQLGLLAGAAFSLAFLRLRPRSIGSSVSSSILFGIITPPVAFLGANVGIYCNLRIKARFIRVRSHSLFINQRSCHLQSLENPEQFTQAMVDIIPKMDPTNADYDTIRVLAAIPPTRSSWKDWAANINRVAQLAPSQSDSQDDGADNSPARKVSGLLASTLLTLVS